MRHNRIVDFKQQFGAVSLLFRFTLRGAGTLEIQRILDGNGDLARALLQQSHIFQGECIVSEANDAQSSNWSALHNEWNGAAGVNAGCAVPLIVQGGPIGTLSVVSFRDDAFTLEDVRLLQQCSSQIAIAVQNALNFESARAAEREAKQERDRSKLLLEVNNAVVSHLDVSEVLKSVSTRLREVVSGDSVFIALCVAEDTIEL